MAGVDKEFDGTARPLPGASIGYLPQEPKLEFETVRFLHIALFILDFSFNTDQTHQMFTKILYVVQL